MPILSVRDPEEANPSDLVFAEDSASAARALGCGASAVVIKPGCAAASWDPEMGIVEADQPRLWFAKAAKLLALSHTPTGVHPTAVIGSHVELGERVSIGPGVVIDDVTRIGNGTLVEAGAVVGPYVSIGENCHIYPRVTVYRR